MCGISFALDLPGCGSNSGSGRSVTVNVLKLYSKNISGFLDKTDVLQLYEKLKIYTGCPVAGTELLYLDNVKA